MMNLTNHETKGADGYVTIRVLDEPGAGGAYHKYQVISGDNTCRIQFQNGPIAENGVNGLTNEALLTIVEHRLECFQSGGFKCDENQIALEDVRKARGSLHRRTRNRQNRGVEGKSEV